MQEYNPIGIQPKTPSNNIDVSVFPNPTKNWIDIITKYKVNKIGIYDIQGNLIEEHLKIRVAQDTDAGRATPIDAYDDCVALAQTSFIDGLTP